MRRAILTRDARASRREWIPEIPAMHVPSSHTLSHLARAAMLVCVYVVSGIGAAHGEIIPAARRINWDPGVRGDIPARSTICANVRNAPYNAAGNGTADDTTPIQSAIDACATGQVVLVPAGTYRITAPVRVKSGVTLRGEGIGRTIIKGASGFGSRWLIGYEPANYDWSMSSSTARNFTAGVSKGSTQLTTSAAHGWQAGDFLLVDQLEDPTGDPAVTNDGGSGACTWCGRDNGNRPIGQWVHITAVPSTTTVTVEPALYWNYKIARSPQGIRPASLIQNAGIEDLTVDNSVSGARDAVFVHFAVNSWLLRTEVKGSYRRAVDIQGGMWNTIRESVFHDGVPATPTVGTQYGPDRAYGIFMGPSPTACLIENNIFYSLSLMLSLEGAPSGNVISYNYFTDSFYKDSEWGRLTIGMHGAHPMMNLIEGNHSGDKFDADNYWGTSSHQTFFRNRMYNVTGKLYGSWGFDLYKGVQYYNIVGNVLGTDFESIYEITGNFTYTGSKSIYRLGFVDAGDDDAAGNDPLVKSTLLRHGNWDSVTNGTVWDPNIADHTIPDSLYLTGKPSWFGNLPYPAYGPDRTPMSGVIPAEARYKNGSTRPRPPANLQAQ
jgi:Pectate lyase superfamily protein